MPPPGDAEFRRAAALAAGGDLVAARSALRGLADAAPDPVDASRALRLSAALDRVLGDTADAVATARRAVSLAGSDDPAAAAALDELGEALLAADRAPAAADAFGQAAARSTSEVRLRGVGRLGPGPRTGAAEVLRRKQAYALSVAGRTDEAARILRDLADAADPFARAGLLVQAAAGTDTLWSDASAAADAVGAAGVSGVPALKADLAFVAAARALDRRDVPAALAQIRAARRHALDGVAPLAYVAAAIAESVLAEASGDDEGAYGSLATGYATLGDLVGRSLSASTFEAPLLELRRRWGPGRFAAAKAAYATRRHPPS